MKNFKKLVVLGLSLLLSGGIVGTGVSAIVNDSETKVEAADTYYIAVKNDAGWSNVNCYCWEGASLGNWPGKAMTNVTINGENNWYYIAISGQPQNCIFNTENGNIKTADLKGITYSEKCAIAFSLQSSLDNGDIPSNNHYFYENMVSSYIATNSQQAGTNTGRIFATWNGCPWDTDGALLSFRTYKIESVTAIPNTPFLGNTVKENIYQLGHWSELTTASKWFAYADIKIEDYDGVQFVRANNNFNGIWNYGKSFEFKENCFSTAYSLGSEWNDTTTSPIILKADTNFAKKVLEAYYSCSDYPYNGYKRIDDLKSNFFGDSSTYDPEATITDYDNSGAYEDTYEGLSHTSSVKIGDKIAFMEAKNSGVSSANPLLTNSINSNNSTLIIVLASITAIGLISVLFITYKRKRA